MLAFWQTYRYFNIDSNIVNKKMAKKQLFLAFRFFLAFDNKAGHNFISRRGNILPLIYTHALNRRSGRVWNPIEAMN